ncbi:major capsid protein [Oricola indica]|uniref:major capsid protein n=1 Tax=Oricola indica TaxID=2872591 RepID=UPI001CC09743|nr:major capsid protein [Oricola indica]
MPEILFPYTNVDLTQEVNRLPNEFGLLNALNVAPSEPKNSQYVRIALKDGVIYVLSAEPRGAPGQIGEDGTETGVILQIPHFPHLEAIRAGDVDGLLEVVNGQITAKSLDMELARKLIIIRKHHSITLEYIRLGMLRGVIKDGKGRTLYDLFDVFDITKKTVDFVLGTAGTDVRAKCEEVVDHTMSNLKGETTSGVESVVSPTFFNKFITHEKVEKFWLQAQNSSEHRELNRQMRGGNWGRVFEFGDILFREYKGGLPVKAANGAISTEANVAANKGHAYPAGTQSMFATYEGPVYHIERANEAPDSNGGDYIYVSPKVLDHGEGIELKSQTNRLAVCKQPETLVELSTSN